MTPARVQAEPLPPGDARIDADDGPPPFAPGARPLAAYEVIAHLRRGNDLDVYDVWSLERSSRCIVKTPRADRLDSSSAVERLLHEGRLLERLTHPHIVRGYETVEGPIPAVVMETLAGETLSRMLDDRPDGLSPGALAQLGLQLGSAIAYMHRLEILHLDLKPSNVIAEAGRAKLIDLSLARVPGPAPRGVGTWCYLSPEQARGEELGYAADVWGIGATLYEGATGSAPFDEPGDDDAPGEDEYPQLRRRARRADAGRTLPGELADAIAAALEPESARRPELAELMSSLEQIAELPASERRWRRS